MKLPFEMEDRIKELESKLTAAHAEIARLTWEWDEAAASAFKYAAALEALRGKFIALREKVRGWCGNQFSHSNIVHRDQSYLFELIKTVRAEMREATHD